MATAILFPRRSCRAFLLKIVRSRDHSLFEFTGDAEDPEDGVVKKQAWEWVKAPREEDDKRWRLQPAENFAFEAAMERKGAYRSLNVFGNALA